METKPYDPRLREAAEEFNTLCKKYDCMGTVLFSSRTHSEFSTYLDASWSVFSVEEPGKIRFRSKIEDFGGDREAQKAATEDSLHALTSVVEWSRKINESYRFILKEVGKHVRVMWTAWGAPDSIPGDGK